MAGVSSSYFEDTLGNGELIDYNADSEVELNEEDFDDVVLLHFIPDGEQVIVEFSIQDDNIDKFCPVVLVDLTF